MATGLKHEYVLIDNAEPDMVSSTRNAIKDRDSGKPPTTPRYHAQVRAG